MRRLRHLAGRAGGLVGGVAERMLVAVATPATHTGASPEPPPGLGAAELEVEAADLELLVRIRGELDVLLHPVVLVGLDDGQPREVLEKDLRHLAIRVGAEL